MMAFICHHFLFLYIKYYTIKFMKNLKDYIFISEARKNDTAVKPFTSKEELMAFVDEVEKTKLIIKKYEDEAQKYFDEMSKNEKKASKEFDALKLKSNDPSWHEKYDEIYQGKYKIDEIMQKAYDVTKAPDCVKANDKLYGELQQRALDSLTPKEQKAIGSRGGRLYNILNAVFKKYMHYDFIKNKEA